MTNENASKRAAGTNGSGTNGGSNGYNGRNGAAGASPWLAPSDPGPDERLANIRLRARIVGAGFIALFFCAAVIWYMAGAESALIVLMLGAMALFAAAMFLFQDLLREDSKKAKRIRDRDARYRQTLALLPEGVVILGEGRRIEWVNEQATVHMGVRQEDAGKPFFDVVTDRDFERWLSEGDFASRFMLEQPGGSRIFEVAVVAPDARHTLIVTHDVTERRRIDDMRRDFVANVSHELRTPLTVISGFLETEVEQPGAPSALLMHHRQLMVEQTRRMKRLLEDLLMLSGLENADEPGSDEPAVIAMPKLVEDVVREGKALSNGRHEITMEVEDVSLIGQPEEIRSAAMNLVSNAVRYTPDGGSIHVVWRRQGTGAIFSVRDTGIGIATKHIPRLTERFFRVDKGRSRATGGTGLGLAIVKHILRRNGGELGIESELGKGSTFSMRFPESRIFRPIG